MGGNEDATEVENPQDYEDDNVPNLKCKAMFNKDIPWKKQLSILANGYQLCYEKKITVKDYWLSFVTMSKEHSFQIKSFFNEHNYTRNFKLGSIVNYR
uniref:Uncharacterized protein n=1 Tax=Lactuca sativa TaxID=4236 RepID=A0A9R1V6S6_LACSA|nr:hypothetical protein LSAT_V11C600299810 [Lactuca sativa]